MFNFCLYIPEIFNICNVLNHERINNDPPKNLLTINEINNSAVLNEKNEVI